MVSEIVDTVLVPTLYTVLLALATALSSVAITAIRRWGENQKNSWASGVVYRAAEAAERAVLMVNQVFTERARGVDGKLSASSSREAMAMALGAVRDQLGSDGLSMLIRATGSEDAAARTMKTLVEAAVQGEKPTVTVRQSADAFLGR
jgi:hypothetical protein